jgi:hypothetical protein
VNLKYLGDFDLIAEMTKVWKVQKNLAPFFSKLQKVIKFYKLYHNKRVEDHKGKERGLKSWLKVAHECMQQDLQNDILRDRLNVVLEDSKAFEELRLSGIQKRAMAKLIWKGHATTKEFFCNH